VFNKITFIILIQYTPKCSNNNSIFYKVSTFNLVSCICTLFDRDNNYNDDSFDIDCYLNKVLLLYVVNSITGRACEPIANLPVLFLVYHDNDVLSIYFQIYFRMYYLRNHLRVSVVYC